MSNRCPERGLKVRKAILASSIALTITVYLIITTIALIIGSEEDGDGTYADNLFNEVSPLKSVLLQFIHRFAKNQIICCRYLD